MEDYVFFWEIYYFIFRGKNGAKRFEKTSLVEKFKNKWYTLLAKIKAILRGYHERSALPGIHKVLGIY